MSGKIIGIVIVTMALIFGAIVYYTQVYAYYEDVTETAEITMINLVTGKAEAISVDDLSAIDGTSSPLRFRACFTTPTSDATFSETYEVYEEATPLIGPGWFDCFDANEIGHALEQGKAMAFVGQREINNGVDRVVAIFPDGRGYVWHQLNEKFAE